LGRQRLAAVEIGTQVGELRLVARDHPSAWRRCTVSMVTGAEASGAAAFLWEPGRAERNQATATRRTRCGRSLATRAILTSDH